MSRELNAQPRANGLEQIAIDSTMIVEKDEAG